MLPKILLVEDDQTLGYALKTYLEMHHYLVSWEPDGLKGKDAFLHQAFDLCILDVMMPKMDGFTLAEIIKKQDACIPLIFLTAKSMKIDKLLGFQKGADDYIVKPIDEEELIARIEAILRRSSASRNKHSSYQIGQFEFDWKNRRLSSETKTCTLTEKETRILQLLCEKKNQLVDRKEILQKIWGHIDYFNRRSMDVHMAKLRKHLHHDSHIKITNVHGKGYILEDDMRNIP